MLSNKTRPDRDRNHGTKEHTDRFWNEGRLLRLRRVTLLIARLKPGNKIRHFLSRILPGPPTQITISDFDGDLNITLRLDEHMQKRIFWFGYYSQDVVSFLKKTLSPGMTVIDAGANIGEVTLLSAKRVGTGGKVIAYEPVPEIAEKLRLNVAINNFRQIIVEQMALSDTEGAKPIFRESGKGRDKTVNDGTGSLFVDHAFRARRADGEVAVSTLDRRLDELGVRNVDVVKMDIEGSELPAIRGALSTLTSNLPLLIIEVQEETTKFAGYSAEDIFGYLSNLGYQYETISSSGRIKPLLRNKLKPFQNVICIPPR